MEIQNRADTPEQLRACVTELTEQLQSIWRVVEQLPTAGQVEVDLAKSIQGQVNPAWERGLADGYAGAQRVLLDLYRGQMRGHAQAHVDAIRAEFDLGGSQ